MKRRVKIKYSKNVGNNSLSSLSEHLMKALSPDKTKIFNKFKNINKHLNKYAQILKVFSNVFVYISKRDDVKNIPFKGDILEAAEYLNTVNHNITVLSREIEYSILNFIHVDEYSYSYLSINQMDQKVLAKYDDEKTCSENLNKLKKSNAKEILAYLDSIMNHEIITEIINQFNYSKSKFNIVNPDELDELLKNNDFILSLASKVDPFIKLFKQNEFSFFKLWKMLTDKDKRNINKIIKHIIKTEYEFIILLDEKCVNFDNFYEGLISSLNLLNQNNDVDIKHILVDYAAQLKESIPDIYNSVRLSNNPAVLLNSIYTVIKNISNEEKKCDAVGEDEIIEKKKNIKKLMTLLKFASSLKKRFSTVSEQLSSINLDYWVDLGKVALEKEKDFLE